MDSFLGVRCYGTSVDVPIIGEVTLISIIKVLDSYFYWNVVYGCPKRHHLIRQRFEDYDDYRVDVSPPVAEFFW